VKVVPTGSEGLRVVCIGSGMNVTAMRVLW